MDSTLRSIQVAADNGHQQDIVKTPEGKNTMKAQIFKQASVIFKSETQSVIDEDRQYLNELTQMSQRGRIELIMGPMFAGKSTELLRRVKRLEISGKKCLSIKYAADNRYSKDAISTHDQIIRSAVACKKLGQVAREDWMLFDVIGIDEGQFFDDVVEFAETAANAGKIVILSALNGTYEKKGWQNILELIPLCEKVKKLSAICKICSSNANYTFRTCQGSTQELIGGADMYMPLCRECYNHKQLQQQIKQMDDIGSAGQKENMLSSSANSTNFNESTDGEKNNSFEQEKKSSDRLINMNALRELEKSNSSCQSGLRKASNRLPVDSNEKSIVTPVRSKVFDEDLNNELEAAGQKPIGERTMIKLQTSGNKILSYTTNLEKLDADDEQLRIKKPVDSKPDQNNQ